MSGACCWRRLVSWGRLPCLQGAACCRLRLLCCLHCLSLLLLLCTTAGPLFRGRHGQASAEGVFTLMQLPGSAGLHQPLLRPSLHAPGNARWVSAAVCDHDGWATGESAAAAQRVGGDPSSVLHGRPPRPGQGQLHRPAGCSPCPPARPPARQASRSQARVLLIRPTQPFLRRALVDTALSWQGQRVGAPPPSRPPLVC